ncbi:plasmid replication initiator TrfA [Caldimonas thermodepolymerans]|uniref:plasmid replication initiator TrfA n=1 Tax=Caldimonas thermodepolymerans TaxID=215580 RepID=UPI002235ABC4|nr:plasmid replication initiator TrfA [Caldimonas thermodepolymerans]UZG44307.1 plasmid replication initiator TrfA [Caldimonas thermodepolymerans]UZG47974.1 plasmid replication initiator TrfA [Caldimonas thermodepolymerans]
MPRHVLRPTEAHGQDRHRQEPGDPVNAHRAACSQCRDRQAGPLTYIGGLIRFAAKDEETQEWVIELDEKLRPLFAADQFTQVEWAVRHALDGHQLAQWLHGFYASHAKPFPIKIETLHRLCGSPFRGGLPTPARTGKVRGTNVAPICMKFSTVQTSSQCLETQAGRGFTPDRAAGVRETAVDVMQQFCSL